ncbi:hypothetical protein Nepgr_027484 [Nepenthes gracilis]|uniref:Kinesin light chain n=1 Tax=Nepenthes gracilis TaxID=150966 RepID=A0AAD3TBF4_NEPGR|nr:hypothetical protein Nepgr_027484 [Nepenthes gracilis]
MPGLKMDEEVHRESASNLSGRMIHFKRNFSQNESPRSPLSAQSRGSDSIDLAIDLAIDESIDQLYHNICEMQSSDQSPSMRSFTTFGNESRIDAELNRLVGGEQIREAEEALKGRYSTSEKENQNASKEKLGKAINGRQAAIAMSIPSKTKRSKEAGKPPIGRRNAKISKRSNLGSSSDEENNPKAEDNSDLGPYLLKRAMNIISSGDNLKKAFEFALRAKKSFEKCSIGKCNLDFVMCLQILASIYCSSGQYNQAIPLLEKAIEIPYIEAGQNHALAKFAGCMQLGDIYALKGQIENSLAFYLSGLDIQRQVLGGKDSRFGKTCRYVAEAHVEALQLDEAEKLCKMALGIHKETGPPMSIEEASDRRLMGLIYDSKGDHEAALEHYVLASMALTANGLETDKAAVDCSIGDAYLSLARYDEAIFSYQKALGVLKSSKGENHPEIASVYVRLSELYNKIGKFSESKSYRDNAFRIYTRSPPRVPLEEIATGLFNLAAIYESMQELEQALGLLQMALEAYSSSWHGQRSTIACLEAQMGALSYMLGRYSDSYKSFKRAISKFKACGETRSALCGIALNQMGLACVQLCCITEAAELFEEGRSVMEKEFGPHHPHTLGVYSNLAGVYDALGRWDDAAEILEFVVGIREEKLGTADPIVADEKQRLAALLKEAGRAVRKKSRSLETLFEKNSPTITKNRFGVNMISRQVLMI